MDLLILRWLPTTYLWKHSEANSLVNTEGILLEKFGEGQIGRTYLPTKYLINNLHSEYIKISQNSILRKQPSESLAKDLSKHSLKIYT